jgi:Phage T7 capsid assembly protein
MTVQTVQAGVEDNTSAEQEANAAALAAAENIDTNPDAAAQEVIEQAAQTNDRPEWLPEKFKSPEDMATAYKELESKQGSQEQTTEEDNAGTADADADVFDVASDEFYEAGELSDGTYKKLEAAGINREMVDQYIAGVSAVQAQVFDAVTGAVGGEEAYSKMTDWAANNMTEAQLNAFNAQVETGDLATAQLAVQGLAAQYQQAVGTMPTGFQLGGGQEASGSSFASVAELQSAMSDPRYSNDPAYRADVAKRLNNSNIL